MKWAKIKAIILYVLMALSDSDRYKTLQNDGSLQ